MKQRSLGAIYLFVARHQQNCCSFSRDNVFWIPHQPENAINLNTAESGKNTYALSLSLSVTLAAYQKKCIYDKSKGHVLHQTE